MIYAKMSDLHGQVDDGHGIRIGMRPRLDSKHLVRYTITFDDANLIPGHVLEVLARKLLGSDRLWWVIADANPVRHPGEWKMNDEILLPLDEDSITSTRNRNRFGK